MLHICKSYDNDVCLKFTDIGDGKFANAVLTEVVEQRKNYTESRRNNRKGTKDKNICSTYDNTYVPHMVNKDKDVINNNNGDDFFKTNAEAHQWFVGNYQDIEKAKNILSNLGWASVTDEDVAAVLFHFLESQVDIEKQPKSDIRSHFKRWLNRQKSEDMVKLTVTIKNRHARLKAQIS